MEYIEYFGREDCLCGWGLAKIETMCIPSYNDVDINDAIGTELDSENYDSLGGLMIEMLDRLPEEGEEVTVGDVKLKCTRIEKNRVERVELFGEGYGKKKPGKEDGSEDRTGEGAGTEERDS